MYDHKYPAHATKWQVKGVLGQHLVKIDLVLSSCFLWQNVCYEESFQEAWYRTARRAALLAGSPANTQSHRAVWLRLPPQFKTDALHQHWQHGRARGRQLFWVN